MSPDGRRTSAVGRASILTADIADLTADIAKNAKIGCNRGAEGS